MWKWLTKDLFGGITNILDELFTTEEERIQARNKIQQLILNQEDKINELKASIINTEAKGNFLQRSWRPILMLLFGLIVAYNYFIALVFGLPTVEFAVDFWSLLKIGIGGYVVGRSAEKISENITINRKVKQ